MRWLRLVGSLKFLILFCKSALQKRRYSAKETYNFMEPTNHSHPICHISSQPIVHIYVHFYTCISCIHSMREYHLSQNRNSIRILDGEKRNYVRDKHVQHTAKPCNTLQHTATHCNTLRHAAAHCNTLQHTTTHCSTLQHTVTHCNTLHYSATHCNTLQHSATHCSTLYNDSL